MELGGIVNYGIRFKIGSVTAKNRTNHHRRINDAHTKCGSSSGRRILRSHILACFAASWRAGSLPSHENGDSIGASGFDKVRFFVPVRVSKIILNQIGLENLAGSLADRRAFISDDQA